MLDILETADRIAIRVARGREYFDAEEDTQLALVHLIEIVGEACAGVSAETRHRHPAVPWQGAARMRNRVIHGYFDIDLNLVWTAAAEEVPALVSAVRAALDESAAEVEGDH